MGERTLGEDADFNVHNPLQNHIPWLALGLIQIRHLVTFNTSFLIKFDRNVYVVENYSYCDIPASRQFEIEQFTKHFKLCVELTLMKKQSDKYSSLIIYFDAH